MPDLTQTEGRQAWAQGLIGTINADVWDHLTRTLFAWQFEQVTSYRRLCLGRGITPENLKTWSDIPAVPQQLFKRDQLYAAGLSEPATVYETSGTTTGQPGRQHLLSPDIYRTVSVEGARQAGLFAGNPQFHFLTPSPKDVPHSSLSAMFGFWGEEARQTDKSFWVRDGQFAFADFRKTIERQIRGAARPIAVCGTAFSFVHLLDAWADLPPLRLPSGSWLLETGGFKGRSREIAKADLYAQISRLFTVADENIWNEYGMSELSSQAYARGTLGLHQVPPWARVQVCDPATNREVPVGKQGLIRWFDLANTDSVLALQTLDLAERTAEGFRLIGRLPRTEPRGCSLSAEDLAART